MKIILSGYQKASLHNLYSYFLYKKKKIDYIPKKYFSLNFIFTKQKNVKSKKNLRILKLFLEKEVILGTSETFLECNIGNFFSKKKKKYKIFIDSSTNLKKRLKFFEPMPSKILVNNSLIKKKILEIIKTRKVKIIDLKMPYQKYLKKKYGSIIRSNKYYLYVTSNLGISLEKVFINNLYNSCKSLGKKLKVLVHPRENLEKWKKEFYDSNINFYKNKNFYKNEKINNVFGISTMALVNFKFAGFNSFYFNKKKNELEQLLLRYKVKKVYSL
jgi:hypothetical protein